MPKKFSRDEVLSRLNGEIAAGRSILAVGTGNGLSARCAESGGADLSVVYSSGYFRVNGLPSLVGNMPVGDANEIMFRLGRESIVPRRRTIPVIAGVFGADPTRDLGDILDRVEAIGYSGVINFPTIGRHVGTSYRSDLENAGLGFEREVALMTEARARDLFTMAYVYDETDAAAMARVGVDCIVGHLGLTAGGDIGAKAVPPLESTIPRLKTIFAAARAVEPEILLLSHGGPISTPSDAEYVNTHAGSAGFVAASSFERIPIERALTQACVDFKSIQTRPSI